jgi:hypothetical protein
MVKTAGKCRTEGAKTSNFDKEDEKRDISKLLVILVPKFALCRWHVRQIEERNVQNSKQDMAAVERKEI